MNGPDHDVGISSVTSVGDRPIELDDFRNALPDDTMDTTTSREAHREQEAQPLLEADTGSTTTTFALRHQSHPRHILFSSESRRAYCLNIMEKVKKSKVAYYIDKLAVTSEPGLTNAQLMLTNFDLKPGIFSSTSPGAVE